MKDSVESPLPYESCGRCCCTFVDVGHSLCPHCDAEVTSIGLDSGAHARILAYRLKEIDDEKLRLRANE